MKRLTALLVGVTLICLLSGCAGLLLLAFQAVSIGALYAQVSDLLGRDSSDYSVYLDGYDLGIHPATNGRIDLSGVPVGDGVLSLVSSDKRAGFHANVTVVEGQALNLGQITPITGAIIAGKVERLVGTTRVPQAGVRVAAVFGGGSLVTVGKQPIELPTGSDKTVMLGFTNSLGQYQLGPAEFGQWIVTSAYPGHLTDAAIVTVASGSDAGNTNLLLKPDSAAAANATVRGTVASSGGSALASALVASQLGTAFAPAVDPTRLSALAGLAGGTLMDQPWFRWHSLATVTSVAGAYDFEVPAGSQTVYGFKYGYRAKSAALTLSAGAVQAADFALTAR